MPDQPTGESSTPPPPPPPPLPAILKGIPPDNIFREQTTEQRSGQAGQTTEDKIQQARNVGPDPNRKKS